MSVKKFNAIVLSGGGIKGLGILGGLQYLMDNKYFDKEIKYYSGTSIGSVICFFLAIGYTPIEMMVYCITHKVFEIKDINSVESIFKGEGLYDFSIFNSHFEKMTIDKIGYIPTLKDLHKKMKKTLYTCTYNITKKKKEYLSYHTYPDMLCIDAIRLSCSLPFIFNDSIYNDECFIDGGFVDNCPVYPIKDKNANIIIFQLDQKESIDYYKTVIEKFYTIIMIPVNELQKLQLKKKKSKCKFISLLVEPTKIYEFNISHSNKLELFSIGYNSTKNFLTK